MKQAKPKDTESHRCPHCGYCEHCGQSTRPQVVPAPYRVYPWHEWQEPRNRPYRVWSGTGSSENQCISPGSEYTAVSPNAHFSC